MADSSIRRKLIEVALPLAEINAASAREKSIRHGHPSTLHLWWARRPLAACRAVLFSSLVDDPDDPNAPTSFVDACRALPKGKYAEIEDTPRMRLFDFIARLVRWQSTTDEDVLSTARTLIMLATDGNPPPVLDPFAGGGSIPLEALRLGLEAHASDLNPVAVLINKAMIEIPPRFAGMPPVNPDASSAAIHCGWKGAAGLAEDVRYYSKWMRDQAEKRIGRLYPKAKLTNGAEATVTAWLWARTVTCPNPACGAEMPLVRGFELSKKMGKEAWVQPIVEQGAKRVRFEIGGGKGTPPRGTVSRRGATCIVCKMPVPLEHIRAEGQAGRIGSQLMAIVAEGRSGRIYLPPDDEHAQIAIQAQPPDDVPDTDLPKEALGFRVQNYGMTRHRDVFTRRQLVALTTFSDLVCEALAKIAEDVRGHHAYAEAVATYLGLGVGRLSDICNALCGWEVTKTQVCHLFTRQAISMLWDYAEPNVFGGSTGDYVVAMGNILRSIENFPTHGHSRVRQSDAQTLNTETAVVISTDPPYYDNVPYADLSDFFYVWLRRSLRSIHSDVLGTMLVPKTDELVADPFRHGGKEKARDFFERGMVRVFERMRVTSDLRFPATVYYAFKQAESDDGVKNEGEQSTISHSSTGWETFLQGLIDAGWQVDGTWPMRTERSGRMRDIGSNALASSVVLVCRPRPAEAGFTTRRDFLDMLKKELPQALRDLQSSGIQPVDLAQAAIGPGMAVFSRYGRVLEPNGASMPVRTALQIINHALDEVLTEQTGAYDPDTRWAMAWFEQIGFNEAPFGGAETLSKAKDTSVQGMVDAGIITSGKGKVRLLRPEELPVKWDPTTDNRRTVWECTHHLVRILESVGEEPASDLLSRIGADADAARDLAYRLYNICERKGWNTEALWYNGLVASWPELLRLAHRSPVSAQSTALELDLT